MRLRIDFSSVAQESLGSMAIAPGDVFQKGIPVHKKTSVGQPAKLQYRKVAACVKYKSQHFLIKCLQRCIETELPSGETVPNYDIISELVTAATGQDCFTHANFISQLIRMNDVFVEMSLSFISLTAVAFSTHINMQTSFINSCTTAQWNSQI